jgi:putative transposase
VKPRARPELAEWTKQVYELSQRHAARLIPVPRMTLRYQHHLERHEALRVRLRELAGSQVRYGYRRLTILLQREGWEVNAKRIYRLYAEEGLKVRTRRRRNERNVNACRKGKPCAGTKNGAWISLPSGLQMVVGSVF